MKERVYCPSHSDLFPKNPDEVAWPNATEVHYGLVGNIIG